MTFLLITPTYCREEHSWIAEVLLNNFLGVEFVTACSAESGFCLVMDGKRLTLSDSFFQKAAIFWQEPQSLPALPLPLLDVGKSGLDVKLVTTPLPVLFGTTGVEIGENYINLGLDIFGSAFFMLSRYEEVVLTHRDSHDRFPASASISLTANFVERPIVDEYVEVLWSAIAILWPNLKRKINIFRKLISCDVDHAYVCGAHSLKQAFRQIGGDVLKRRSPSMATANLLNFFNQHRGNYSHDPYYQAIDWMMDVNENVGNKIAFYFIVEHSHPNIDGCYHMDEIAIRSLLKRIALRGHEIGLHGSYYTYQNVDQLQREVNTLRRVLEEENIQQDFIGGRQHVLRWKSPTTAVIWDTVGMDYDSTLAFAERAGFRCGTCREYPMFDTFARRKLGIKQRPLVLMESTVIAKRYMNLGYSKKSIEKMQYLKEICRKFNGDFTLLWHNTHFQNINDKLFYEELIS